MRKAIVNQESVTNYSVETTSNNNVGFIKSSTTKLNPFNDTTSRHIGVILSTIMVLLFFIFAVNTTTAQYNPYYTNPSLRPPVINWWFDSANNGIMLNITSPENRVEVFKIYQTEAGVSNVIATDSLTTTHSISLLIQQGEPGKDVFIQLTSKLPSGVLEYIEWEQTFPASMFEPPITKVKIASVDSIGYIHWAVNMDSLDCCIVAALSCVYEFEDTISRVEPITIRLDSMESDYILNYDIHFANSTEVFSDNILLTEEDGDIYVDTDKEQPITWKVAIVIAIKAALTVSTTPKLPLSYTL